MEELVTLVGKCIAIETSDGRMYEGDLLGVDDKLNLIIKNVKGKESGTFKMVINGAFVKEIKLIEKPFNLRALAERMNRVFPGMAKISEDIGAIVVMDRYKVTENGVEGTGLTADKVRDVYNEFLKANK